MRTRNYNLLIVLVTCLASGGIGPCWLLAAGVAAQNSRELAVVENRSELRTAAWPFFERWRRPIYDSTGTNPSPHPAVARIIVPEGRMTSYGSGTLVDAREKYGLVVTNWHVVRDSKGVVEVVFPSGFRSQARALKVDSDWDLAALVIWRPPIEPVKLAGQAPQAGDLLTIHGYGQGEYRIATGRCTRYYAPRLDFPREMVELDVEARQGDSGGPIFNQRGELAGVLFGAGEGTTLGSFGPRVANFLATLAPDIGEIQDQSELSVAERPAPAVHSLTDCRPNTNENGLCQIAPSAPGSGETHNRSGAANYPSSPWSPPGSLVPSKSAATVRVAEGSGTSDAGTPTTLSWQDISGSSWFESAKSLLATVGLASIALQIVKLVR